MNTAISFCRIEPGPRFDLITIYSRGDFSGALRVKAGDSADVVRRLIPRGRWSSADGVISVEAVENTERPNTAAGFLKLLRGRRT